MDGGWGGGGVSATKGRSELLVCCQIWIPDIVCNTAWRIGTVYDYHNSGFLLANVPKVTVKNLNIITGYMS